MENGPKKSSEWFLIIEEYRNSHLTQAEFCKQKNLVLGRFVYYLKNYRKRNNLRAQREKPSFSEISVSHSVSGISNEIKIELPNGFRCQVPSTISMEALKKLLGALISC